MVSWQNIELPRVDPGNSYKNHSWFGAEVPAGASTSTPRADDATKELGLYTMATC